MIMKGQTEVLWEEAIRTFLCSTLILHGMVWNWTPDCTVKIPRLTAWSMARDSSGAIVTKLRAVWSRALIPLRTRHVPLLTFIGPCIVIYSYNESQRDALFLKFILAKNSTCFGQIYCPSSGVSTLYKTKKAKLRGLSPHANYTDRAAAAGRRS